MATIIQRDLLLEFMSRFLGYGSLESPIWMVGMEESCGGDDFVSRIAAWDARGRKEIEDAAEYHKAIGHEALFSEGAKIQKTWSKLIRVYLAFNGLPTDTNSTRQFQINVLGRLGKNDLPTCLLELMPLPSPSTTTWKIGCYTDIDFLSSRKQYMQEIAPRRIEMLARLISRHKPKAVVFYGSSYSQYWSRISGQLVELPSIPRVSFSDSGETAFFVVPHPVARRVTNRDFILLGETLRKSSQHS